MLGPCFFPSAVAKSISQNLRFPRQTAEPHDEAAPTLAAHAMSTAAQQTDTSESVARTPKLSTSESGRETAPIARAAIVVGVQA